jgi:hypothetical protein
MAMKIWVGNLSPKVGPEAVKQLLLKYGFPEPTEIVPISGDGTRPGMVVNFEGVNPEMIRPLVGRVDGLFWEGSHTSVAVLPPRTGAWAGFDIARKTT